MPSGLCFCLSVGPAMGLKWQKCLCCVTLSNMTAGLLPHQGRDWLARPLEMDAQARFMLWNWGGEVERGGELCGLSHCEIFLTCISKSSKNARSNYTLTMRLAQRHLVWLFISDYHWQVTKVMTDQLDFLSGPTSLTVVVTTDWPPMPWPSKGCVPRNRTSPCWWYRYYT